MVIALFHKGRLTTMEVLAAYYCVQSWTYLLEEVELFNLIVILIVIVGVVVIIIIVIVTICFLWSCSIVYMEEVKSSCRQNRAIMAPGLGEEELQHREKQFKEAQ